MFLILGVVFCLVFRQADLQAADPVYVVNIDSPVYVCPDEGSQEFVDTSEIEVHRHNESTTILTGVFKLLKDLHRLTFVELVLEKEASGHYELMTSVEICDLCDEIEDPESNYKKYLKYFGFPEECPLESNVYNIDNFVADTSELPINSANMGRYQATINFYSTSSGACKGEDFLACIKLDLIIEPV